MVEDFVPDGGRIRFDGGQRDFAGDDGRVVDGDLREQARGGQNPGDDESGDEPRLHVTILLRLAAGAAHSRDVCR